MAFTPRGALALSLLAASLGGQANAQASSSYELLGITQIFDNDWFGMPIGDRFDRWRTGSYQSSAFIGRGWDGELPSDPFALLELRFRAEIIAPDNLAAPAAGDRLYAPSLTFGASTHFEFRGLEVGAGADLVLVGDQTGLMDIHNSIHQTFGGSEVNLSGFMVEDGTYLNATIEGARTIEWGASQVRPFIEAQAGVETLARVGVDARFGDYDEAAFLIRDPITGQRVQGIPGDGGGWSFSAGADLAFVGDSVLLPSEGPDAESLRFRLRGGVNYDFGVAHLLYGVTYLSEEFEGQDQGQLVGSIALTLPF